MGCLKLRSLMCVAVFLLGAMVLTACGGSSSDSTSSSGSTESAETESAGGESAGAEGESEGAGGLAAAEKAVEEATAPAELNLSSEPLDMKKNAGKTVYFIASSLQLPFNATLAKGFEAAAEAAGVNAVTFDGKGKADIYNQGVETAIAQNAAGIVLQAVDPAIVSGPLAKAKQQGISVIDVFNRGPDAELPSTIEGEVTLDYPQSGRTMANFIAADSGGDAKIGLVTWGTYQVYKEMVPAIEEELEKNCPDCELLATKVASPTAPATEVQNLTTAMLRQYPEMDYLAPVSDGLGLSMLPAAEAAGREVKIVTADGQEAALEALEDEGPYAADASDPPLESIGWASMDEVGRLMAGQKSAPENANLATQLFVSGQVPPLEERWPGFEGFEEKYEQLWGVK